MKTLKPQTPFKQLLDYTEITFTGCIVEDQKDSFSIKNWLTEWVRTPNWSLNGKTPQEYLDLNTDESMKMVKQRISVMISGAYL